MPTKNIQSSIWLQTFTHFPLIKIHRATIFTFVIVGRYRTSALQLGSRLEMPLLDILIHSLICDFAYSKHWLSRGQQIYLQANNISVNFRIGSKPFISKHCVLFTASGRLFRLQSNNLSANGFSLKFCALHIPSRILKFRASAVWMK